MGQTHSPHSRVPSKFLDASTPIFFDEELNSWHVFRYHDVAKVLRSEADFDLMVRDHMNCGCVPTGSRFPDSVSLAPMVDALTGALVDRAVHQGRLEIMADLAQPLPALVMADLLGLEPPDRRRLVDLVRSSHAFVGESGSFREVQETVRTRFDAFSRTCVTAPKSSVCGHMMLMAALGAATVIGNTLVALIRFGLMEELKGAPERIPGAIEESLRWDAPVPAVRGLAKTDVWFGDDLVWAGQHVTAWISAGNRDAGQFADPAGFDIDRQPNRHLSFGEGAQPCLGTDLVRLETKTLIQRLLAHRSLSMALDPDRPVERSLGVTQGVRQAHLTITVND